MSQTLEIKLLTGFCNITFGETQENVKKVFGEPQEIQQLNDEILNTNSTVYHYWDKGFSLFFNNLKNSTFYSVEIDSPDTTLFGEKIFSLNESQILSLMKANGFSLSDTEKHDWGEKRLSFDDAGIDYYFSNNKLVSVNFGLTDSQEGFHYFPN